MATHICEKCGEVFEYSGNVKFCESCRYKCFTCGKPTPSRSRYCGSCRYGDGGEKRHMVRCKEKGCEQMVRYDPNRSGHCQEHYNKTAHAVRIADYNRTVKKKPVHLKFKTESLHIVPVSCSVCGRDYLTTPGVIKSGSKNCCSPKCVGINAAQNTPKRDTSIERAIEQAMKERGWLYQKQVPLCGVTLADFFIPAQNVVIYCDGEYWHSSPKRIEQDRHQNKVLSANGYDVYRFTETEIKESAHNCLDQINLESEPVLRQLGLPIFESSRPRSLD